MMPWDAHYLRDRSRLGYPDENLVRLLKKYLQDVDNPDRLMALDLGCGSGRHLSLLHDTGIGGVIGLDLSYTALPLCAALAPGMLVNAANNRIPLKSSSVDIVVAWGSLHYAGKESVPPMIAEIGRILRPGGRLFGTLRSSRDTYLKRGRHLGNDVWVTDLSDIEHSVVSFFSEDELTGLFAGFASLRYGTMERSLVGDISRVIAHWVFEAIP